VIQGAFGTFHFFDGTFVLSDDTFRPVGKKGSEILIERA